MDNAALNTPAEGRTVHVRSRPMASWRQSRLVFPFLIFVIVSGFYWKLTLTQQFDWTWSPDLAQQVMPWFEEEARQLHHGRVPLWDPHTWLGQPLLGQAQPGAAFPLNYLLWAMPRRHGHIQVESLQWYFVAIHFLAALFAYWLCRDLGRSRLASLIGGLIYALAAYVGTTDWPQMVNAAMIAPLVFLFQLRAIRGIRPLGSSALAGMFLGFTWLAGHHQVPLYLSLTFIGIWLFFILRTGTVDWALARLAAVALLLMLFTGALQILPAEEYGHLAKRWAGAEHELTWNEPVPYSVHREYSLNPLSLLAIVYPGWNRHSDPFVGVVALALALLSIALAWRERSVRLFTAVAVGGLVYALGQNSVFQGFLYGVIPSLDKARVPSMAAILFGFGVAVLAAFGADSLYSGSGSLSPWPKRFTQGLFGFGLATYFIVLIGMAANKLVWPGDERIALTGFIALLFAAILYGGYKGNLSKTAALTLTLLLLLLELGNDSGYAFSDRSDKNRQTFIARVQGSPEIAGFLHAQPGPFRIEITTDDLAKGWGSHYDFDYVQAETASVAVNVLELETHTWQTRRLLGVKYTIDKKPPFPDSKDVFTAPNGLKVYENPAFPRAWAVHEIVSVPNSDAGRQIIGGRVDDLRSKAFLQGNAPAVSTCSGDTVTFRKYAPESVLLHADMACNGLLVLSDAYYPGWRATVDGKSAAIYQVDNALRGVPVPQGSHDVAFRYRPASAILGGFLTLIGIGGALALALIERKRAVSH